MTEILAWAGGGVLVVSGLIILQLKSLKKYHPNAELLVGMLKKLLSD